MRNVGGVVLAAVIGLLSLGPLRASENAILLVVEQSRILQLSDSGEAKVFLDEPGSAQSLGDSLYVYQSGSIYIYDTAGKKQRSVAIPPEVRYWNDFLVLPDKRFAFFDNLHDALYFLDENGKHLKTVGIAAEPDSHYQNMTGVAVEGKLIVSENGHGELVAVDLTSYESSVFRSLSQLRGWLGAIAFADGNYYICQGRDVYSFKDESQEVTKLATTPEGNITGIVFKKGHLLAVVNGMSKIWERALAAEHRTREGILYERERNLALKHRTKEGILYDIDLMSGEVTQITAGLNYPQGVLVLDSAGKGE